MMNLSPKIKYNFNNNNNDCTRYKFDKSLLFDFNKCMKGTRGQKQTQHAKQKGLKNGTKSKVDNFPPKQKILK